MGHQAVDEYLTAIFETYQVGSKAIKGGLLDHAVLVLKRSRKQIIRRLTKLDQLQLGPNGAAKVGRPLVYSREELVPHIQYLWPQMERVSAKRMKSAFSLWLPKYKNCAPHLKVQLQNMSPTTLGRYLKGIRLSETPSKGLSTTCPARYMKNKVPINTLDSKITKPGFTQTDTVAHCGDSAQGPFISSLTVTDIHSTWTENRAMFTKRGTEVREKFKDIEKSLPFKLLAINSDSGSEFLNKNMLQFTNFGTRVEFTRSRPYKKNDNCYVEQKNFTHVRELFGYERFEDEVLV
ncbi:MAG: transposase family protein, partial [Bdellovibrionales bacterium]